MYLTPEARAGFEHLDYAHQGVAKSVMLEHVNLKLELLAVSEYYIWCRQFYSDTTMGYMFFDDGQLHDESELLDIVNVIRYNYQHNLPDHRCSLLQILVVEKTGVTVFDVTARETLRLTQEGDHLIIRKLP